MSFNSYWYFGLSFLSLSLLAYTCIKKRNPRILLLFLAMAELAYLIEAFIYIFHQSYLYHPDIIHHNAYYDSHLGALTSNMMVIPAVATFLAAFRVSRLWTLGLIAIIAGIEWLFVKLGIYTLHWWRIEYTSLGLVFYFALAKVMYRVMLQPLKGVLHALCLYLCIAPLSGTLQFLPFMFFSNRVYRPGWFEDPAYDTSAFGVVYYLCISILFVVLVKLRWKHSWVKYLLIGAIVIGVTFGLRAAGILRSQVWWDPWIYSLFPLLLLPAAEAISKRLVSGLKSGER
jgi:hypothetical protein